MLHGSQEWGGKGLGTLKMKHEKGVGCFSWFPRVGWEGLGKAQNEACKRVWVLHGSQAWGGKGSGECQKMPKMKHEKGGGCFMVHKSRVEGLGKVQNGSQEWFGKAKKCQK